MRFASKPLATIAGMLLMGFALAATVRVGQAQPSPKEPAPVTRSNLALDAQAPILLLDPSHKVSARAPAAVGQPQENKDIILPRPGIMHVAMDVMVDGRALSTVHYAGKTYLPVPRTGQEYQIRVWNHGPRRVAAVVSVDGLSVITGQRASEDDPGYIVAPYGSILIKGWRRNLENVAAFRFVDRDRSYANLMGKSENIGVIGLVAFEERIVHPLPMFERRDSTQAAKGFRAAVGSIGTEYGREVDSRAYYVPFVRSGQKRAITLYYDTVDALRAAGVPVDRPFPVPFPEDLKFAPPPPGYSAKPAKG